MEGIVSNQTVRSTLRSRVKCPGCPDSEFEQSLAPSHRKMPQKATEIVRFFKPYEISVF